MGLGFEASNMNSNCYGSWHDGMCLQMLLRLLSEVWKYYQRASKAGAQVPQHLIAPWCGSAATATTHWIRDAVCRLQIALPYLSDQMWSVISLFLPAGEQGSGRNGQAG